MSRNISEDKLQKILKKVCSVEETAPKRKHVRECIVYTWDHGSAKAVFSAFKSMPFTNDEIQLFKLLIVLHKVIQEGHPSALAQAIRDREWIRSLGRLNIGASDYTKLIKEYVKFLMLKLDFHATHKGFKNGTFEYEEYVSLMSVSDLDQGYETILDLMTLQDQLDDFSQVIFASIHGARRNSECKVAALIPLIAESYGMYKFITSMLRGMHSQLNDIEGDAALQPLIERYELQHARMFEFYADCSSIKLLTSLVTIPKLPATPPDVLASLDDDSKAQKKKPQPQPERIPTPEVRRESPAPQRELQPTRTASTAQTISPAFTANVMIPTVTGAVQQAFPQQQQQVQPDFWINQQAQLAQEQQRLEMERQQQLAQQQQQQDEFQRQLQQAQQDMMNMQVQQQNQHQNDLIALTNQYEKDQALLQQYDQRVQQLEDEISNINQNASEQVANKNDQIESLQEQLRVWEKKYDSLAKLYSQLRQEHLQLLPRFKKLQIKVGSIQETVANKEQIEGKLKKKDLQLIDMIKERDRLRLEVERLLANKSEEAAKAANGNIEKFATDTISPILDAVLLSGINTIQESVFNMDNSLSWSGPLAPPSFLLALTDSTSERATEFATSFNNLIVDGLADGDQTAVIHGVSDFSTSIATLVTYVNAYTSSVLGEEAIDDVVDKAKKCAREAEFFFEDLLSDNLSSHDEEGQTDIVINANVNFQEKLQILATTIEKLLESLPTKKNTETNAHTELVATADAIVKSSQQLRVNLDVPKPLLQLALAIIDAVVALVRAAIQVQNEIATTNNIPLSQFYKKNSRWTEGLISAAKAVGGATNILISTASHLVTGDKEASPEEFAVASKEVAASTIQLVAASRVKSGGHSKAQDELEVCSKAVTDACRQLGTTVLGDSEAHDAVQPIEFNNEHQLKTVEMEQQVEILKLEQSLSNARKRLGEIRRHAYFAEQEE
ncbi:Protein SLA2 [Nakaseomyces bracarensis]|uniref:Protein SLA2 n=1 Tax=Nakaseomyces bracarensis TaxID=273131 RepID=A0ABR4NYA6_9SACH